MSLGLVATGKRSIKNGSQYDRYFTSEVKGDEVQLKADGNNYDTLKLMRQVVSKTKSQTKDISKVLKGRSLEETCSNLWKFLYNHVQYKKDHSQREQLRTPARTWADRKSGVDCDCYSIFISSVLTNLGIPHTFRMAGYSGDFQHVYVVVPKSGTIGASRSSYYVIDPVVNQFNYEPPFSKKHDHKMSEVTMLNGLGECNTKPEILRLRKFVDTQAIIDAGNIPTKVFLQEHGIPFSPAFDQQKEEAAYVIESPAGMVKLPTVLSKCQADQLSQALQTSPTSSQKEPAITTDKVVDVAKKNWWWLLIIAGGWILLTGSDQNEVKSGLNGLNGLKKKRTKPKKKLKVVSI